jgi:hypothetical protein
MKRIAISVLTMVFIAAMASGAMAAVSEPLVQATFVTNPIVEIGIAHV